MKNEDVEREAKKLVQRYGDKAPDRAREYAYSANTAAKERYWEAVEEYTLELLSDGDYA